MKRKHFLVEHVGTILGQAELGASVVNLIGKVEARSRPFYLGGKMGSGEGIQPSPRNQTTPRGEHQAETVVGYLILDKVILQDVLANQF